MFYQKYKTIHFNILQTHHTFGIWKTSLMTSIFYEFIRKNMASALFAVDHFSTKMKLSIKLGVNCQKLLAV